MNLSNYVAVIISVFFMISGVSKLFSLKEFRNTLTQLGINNKSNFISIGFPILELLICISILISSISFYSQLLTLFLLTVFLIITLKTMYQKKTIKCNCFGSLSDENFGLNTIIRIALLLTADIYLLFTDAVEFTTTTELVILIQLVIQIFLMYILCVSLYKYVNKMKGKV